MRLAAKKLADSGVQAGERVAVYTGKQYETVVMFLAINARGAILVPINPQLKEQQVRHILLDSGARLLISTGARLRRIEAALNDIELDTWQLEKLQSETLNTLTDAVGGRRINRCTWSGMALCRIGQPPRFFASSLRISSICGRHARSTRGWRQDVAHAKW